MKKLFIIITLALSIPASAQTPAVIDNDDSELYRSIFELQAKGRISAADKEIKKLKSDVLMGYVLYHRYMGPHHRTTYPEAAAWLKRYNDLPGAEDVYKLGAARGDKKNLVRPYRAETPSWRLPSMANNNQMIQDSYSRLPRAARGDIATIRRNFERSLRSANIQAGRKAMEHSSAQRYLSRGDFLRMSAFLAFSHFLQNDDDGAILWARESAEEADFYLAHWTLGLVNWRAGEYELARDHFRSVALTSQLSGDMVSAGAYWAWRANERIPARHMRVRSQELLDIANAHPKTFYGILAQKTRSRRLDIDWQTPQLSLENTREIISSEAGVRALALIQIDRRDLAEKELRAIIANSQAHPDTVHAVLALAEAAKMPGLAINASNYIREYAEQDKFALTDYPIVDLNGDEEWRIDPSLINAIIRQESRFNPRAKSHVGARGLMQIMPATAGYIMRNPTLNRKQHRDRLFDTDLNLDIGQTYIDYLLNMPEIQGNLFKLLLAYNAGPGNLRRQMAKIDNPGEDPLFFIEAISLRESRHYIKRVMANMWIYQNRLYQKNEFLAEIERGEWPVYVSENHKIQPNIWADMMELDKYLDRPTEPDLDETEDMMADGV